MPSKEFESFLWSCFEHSYQAVHDGLDVNALLSLQGDERQQAEALLLEALPTTDDSRAIEAAGYLKLTQASAIIKERLSKGFKLPDLALAAALSLWRIEQYSQSAAIVIDVLKKTPIIHQWTRTGAVYALRYFPKSTIVIQALLDAIQDPDDFVGYLALMSLRHLFMDDTDIRGLIDEITQPGKGRDHQKQYLQEKENLKRLIIERTGC